MATSRVRHLLTTVPLVVSLAVLQAAAFVPVVCLHGIARTAADCAQLGALLKHEHPGQPFFALTSVEQSSYSSLFEQVELVRNELLELKLAHPAAFSQGFHFVGHGQGGLVARAVIETTDNLNVLSFLSLAANQAGEFVLAPFMFLTVCCF